MHTNQIYLHNQFCSRTTFLIIPQSRYTNEGGGLFICLFIYLFIHLIILFI